jgi:hypothetical protein
MTAVTVHENLRAISADFAAGRRERQQRHELVAADFARLRDAGFLLTGVPLDHGGIWESVGGSTRRGNAARHGRGPGQTLPRSAGEDSDRGIGGVGAAKDLPVIDGGTFSRSSPFGYWYEDVRALGFLRPPWGLSYDQLFAA